MVMLKMLYVVEKYINGKLYRYWQPKPKYLVQGVWKECTMRRVALKGENWPDKAQELTRKLTKWRKGYEVTTKAEGTVGWLVSEYRSDPTFKDLEASTQKLYLHYLQLLDKKVGDFPINRVTKDEARKLYRHFAKTTTRGATQFVQVARVVFRYGESIDKVAKNPFDKMKVAKDKARQGILSPEEIKAAKAKAVELGLPSIALAIQMGYDAGQRPGDIREAKRKDYDGKWARFTQSKTKAVVDTPVFKFPVLKAMMDAVKHDSVLWLHEERTGKPYSKDMLCTRVREVFRAAGLGDNVQFRDLRRTAVVRLGESGSTIPEICAITGHALSEATEILKTYLPLSRKMAENAADKVRKVGKTTRKKA